jgi:hypothetical protein
MRQVEMQKFEVWYMKPEWFRDGIMGDEPNAWDLAKTHVHLKDVEVPKGKNVGAEVEAVWVMMQGENWSPNGEARPLIEAKGLRHTSMSVGDVLVDVDTGNVFLAAGVGFKCIAQEGCEGPDFEDDGRSQEAANDRYASRAYKD